jgi:hypothetical protein
VLARARHAAAAGLLKPFPSLTALFDLGPLNQLLRTSGQAQIPQADATPMRGAASTGVLPVPDGCERLSGRVRRNA